MQYDERIKLLREQMRARNIDFYLIPTADDHASEYISDFYKVRNYYAGFTGSAGTLLIGKDMAGLWTDGRYFIQAENQLKGSSVKLFRMGSQGVPTIAEYLEGGHSRKFVAGTSGTGVCACIYSGRKICRKKPETKAGRIEKLYEERGRKQSTCGFT